MLFESLFKSKKTSLLLLLPLILFAQILMGYFGNRIETSVCQGLIPVITFSNHLHDVMWGAIAVLILALLFFFVTMRFKLFPAYTALTGIIYVLLAGSLVWRFGFSNILFAVCVLIGAVNGLLHILIEKETRSGIYNLGFFIMLSVLFCPKLILLLIWGIIVLVLVSRTSLYDILALILGYASTYAIVFFLYYYFDMSTQVYPLFKEYFLFDADIQFGFYEKIGGGLLLVIFLLVFPRILMAQNLFAENQRCSISAIFSLLMTFIITFFFIPGVYIEILYIAAIPLSYLFAYYFVLENSTFLNNLLFLLIIASSILLIL